MFRIAGVSRAVLATLIWSVAATALAAEGGLWSVSKSSGEVWITTSGAGPVSLQQEETLKPGDVVRTGRNGRVLLKRGEETVLLAPNTVIGLPAQQKDDLSTTILQQAGSILLDVEKRNVKHFEVETPYLAAVVKGTEFAVTVNDAGTSVQVRRGQVEVADFKSGQIAQVVPGQTATAFANGKSGLSLSGSGPFYPIEQGRPRASAIEKIPVPKSGLSVPRNTADGKLIHARGAAETTRAKSASLSIERQGAPARPAKSNVVRISTALGDVRLNVHKATNGLARGPETAASAKRIGTVWNDTQAGAVRSIASDQAGNASSNNASAIGKAGSSGASVAAATAAVNAGANGNGNGATGNGKGDSGENGNHGVGNGKGHGNAKH